MLVMLAGALGSYVHTTTSFVTYVGNKSLVDSWTWWYLLRPFIGMALALIFYFTVRGGFLFFTTTGNEAKDISPFSIASLSGLVGMFSKQATDKLKEVFDNLFRTQEGAGDALRADGLAETLPVKNLMLKEPTVTCCRMTSGKNEDDVTIQELYDILTNKTVTRIPILDENNAVRYIIHSSILYKFIAEQSIAAGVTPVDISSLTLRDFLNTSGIPGLVQHSLAFVPESATLGDAKKMLDTVTNCRDVFITATGSPDEPMIGWLSNIEIGKHLKAEGIDSTK